MRQFKKYLLPIVLLIVLSSCKSSFKTSQSFRMIYDDVDNFWRMYDKVILVEDEEERIRLIETKYFDIATFGLKILIEGDKLTAKKYSENLRDTVFFNSIRKTTNIIQSDSFKIREHIISFEKLYPKARFRDVYFVVGQFYHGGTVMNNTMIIEIQKNAKTEATKSEFLFDEKGMKSLINYNSIIPLIIHEQVHVSQKNTSSNTLLSKTITEGSADFIMYLQTKQLTSHIQETYDYGNKNEYDLWTKFQNDLDKDFEVIKKDWFFNYHRKDILPDLGYFMGFKICEKYYNESIDKKEAIDFIMNGKNNKSLLNYYSGGK